MMQDLEYFETEYWWMNDERGSLLSQIEGMKFEIDSLHKTLDDKGKISDENIYQLELEIRIRDEKLKTLDC